MIAALTYPLRLALHFWCAARPIDHRHKLPANVQIFAAEAGEEAA